MYTYMYTYMCLKDTSSLFRLSYVYGFKDLHEINYKFNINYCNYFDLN